ncbi:MAG: N-acetylmuramoyl-L-alanine amidase [Candidatus Calescibacterium sp.]|nr:N-acetylmuramoyl-L-alanine amidase [Candidatus Calescibacterium sp.]
MMRDILYTTISLIFIFIIPEVSYSKINDVVVFEYGEFLRFAFEFSDKVDISFSANRNSVNVIFSKDIGYGRRKAKSYEISWKGEKLLLDFISEFSYVRYFIIPFPYKLIIDVGFSKRDVDDIILRQEDKSKEDRKKVLIIDAGHGGRDPGTTWGNLREKDITLKLSKMLYERFENDENFEVILTRKDDRFIELEERSAIANASECDAFISIHVNSTQSRRSPSGFELFYFSQNFSKYAMRIAQKENGVKIDKNSKIIFDIYSEIRESESYKLAKSISKRIKNIKKVRTLEGAPLYVLAGTFCPSILVEIGFIDNPIDRADILSYSFLRNLSDEIYNGIVDFFEN